MNSYDFTTSAHAKCILAGEHAVLSGCPAIVLPVREKKIDLAFTSFEKKEEKAALITSSVHISSNTDRLAIVQPQGLSRRHPNSAFWAVHDIRKAFQQSLAQALISLNKDFPEEIQGTFTLENNIEIGAGIGFSAALSVVISRWLIWKQWIKEKILFDFARSLENWHHGQSSGVDVAGALCDRIICFQLAQDPYNIEALWHPKLYLSYSGLKKNTKEAIVHVSQLRKQHPAKATFIEDNMKTSVWEIQQALKQEERAGRQLFIHGLKRARSCFAEWGLINQKLQKHLDLLDRLGALVAKPTGAGLGGYVVSLWEKDPPRHEEIEWIAL